MSSADSNNFRDSADLKNSRHIFKYLNVEKFMSMSIQNYDTWDGAVGKVFE